MRIIEMNQESIRSLKEFVDIWEEVNTMEVTWTCLECGRVHKLTKLTCDCGFELPIRVDDN